MNQPVSQGEVSHLLTMVTERSPVFMDFEASSLDLIASYPIEVGVCLSDGEVRSWLIRPHPLWHDWSPKSELIHGIARERLVAEGEDVHDVAHALNECLPSEVFCDAWTFDAFWLHRLFRAAKVKPSFHLESLSRLLSREQLDHWSECRQEVIRDLELDMHRAANDAMTLRETWRRVIRRFPG